MDMNCFVKKWGLMVNIRIFREILFKRGFIIIFCLDILYKVDFILVVVG